MDQYATGISQRLASTAQLIGEDEALLDSCTSEAFKKISATGTGWIGLLRYKLIQLPKALRLRLYRSAIAKLRGDLKHFERLHYMLIDGQLHEGKTGNRQDLPQNTVSTITSEHLLLADRNLLNPNPPITCSITSPGIYNLGNGLSLVVEETFAPASWVGQTNCTAYINPKESPFPWQVRPFRQGERIELLGLNGSRAVQDILTDLKFPRYLRASLPLVCCNNQTLWLAGVCRSRHALIKNDLTQGVRITLSGQEQMPLFP